MSLSRADVALIREVALPEVLSRQMKERWFSQSCLSRPSEIAACTAAAVRVVRGNVTRLSLSLSEDVAVTVSKTRSHDLLANGTARLLTRDFVLQGNRLTFPRKHTWENHPARTDDTNATQAILQSWKGAISLKQEQRNAEGKIVEEGLRSPQIGALHAISAHWTVSTRPAVVVMPTGTGKTEVMLACTVIRRPQRLLVLVPSDALRTQTYEKFLTLGVLRRLGVLSAHASNPVTAIVTKAPKTPVELETIRTCNVAISTVAALTSLPPLLLRKFVGLFDTVFFDEAHHVPAKSWDGILSELNNHAVLMFTATPFRLDGKRIPGRIIYNFPLRMAQEQGYFRKISFKEVFEPEREMADQKIADAAIGQLRHDLALGLDHMLLARADDKKTAENICAGLSSHCIRLRRPAKS